MKLGIVMDPIGSINIKKDSSFAMLLAAQARGWDMYYMELPDLLLRDGEAFGHMRRLEVEDNPAGWYRLDEASEQPLRELDMILMRKDPPFETQYLLATYILEQAEQQGVLIVNRPHGLRSANEKLFCIRFPQCIPPTLVTSDSQRIRAFLDQHEDIVVKPPDAMGGHLIFRLQKNDPNTGVVLETVTNRGRGYAIAQRYLPAIKTAGDKRILMINGEPIPYAFARLPSGNEARANLAAGGSGQGVKLSDRDRWICEQVAPVLREYGLWFAGLDVIGDYLTEINVTSPTCIRELDAIYDLDIAGWLLERLSELHAG